MSEAATILLAIQTVLLLALVGVMFMVYQAMKQATDKANELAKELHDTLQNELKPAIEEARSAIAHTEKAAQAANNVLNAAHPVVQTAGQIAGVFQKPTTPLWLDAARLAFGLVGVLRSRRKESEEPPSKEN